MQARPALGAKTLKKLAVLAAGGCLLQFVGCATGIAPVLISFFENAAISRLFSQAWP